ncbi:hypothetical protein C8Q75DRAFT_709505 [Abortiporus biennis]|nr:hypothetical protein C8Q75DRAFT_709505 [Abortiporus biennis]
MSTTPTSTNPEDYVFFWKIDQPNEWASQWFYSPFTARIQITIPLKEYTFPTAEHWMMGCKALLFNDWEVFTELMEITKISHDTMKVVKGLGRRVENFDEDTWVAARDKIVLRGTLFKFEQNEELKKLLLETGDKYIVEASPLDRIWGVGYGEKRALEMKYSWGLNLLGIALMKAREIIRREGVV